MTVICKLPTSNVTKCSQISNLSVECGFDVAGKAVLTWNNPNDNKFKGLVILSKMNEYPINIDDEEATVIYDSNDAIPVEELVLSGLMDNVEYYFRAFSYTYKNATRKYTSTIQGAQTKGIPIQLKGEICFDVSGEYEIPDNVSTIDLFLVGGGGGGYYGGGAGGKTLTVKDINVEEINVITVAIGAGGSPGKDGGSTTVYVGDEKYTADGGTSHLGTIAGSGGSGGGAGAEGTTSVVAGCGGEDGTDGGVATSGQTQYGKGSGQNTTTRKFQEVDEIAYAAGGGGRALSTVTATEGYAIALTRGIGGEVGGGDGAAVYSNGYAKTYATDGLDGTGSGGGGDDYANAGSGGDGVVIIRWGY